MDPSQELSCTGQHKEEMWIYIHASSAIRTHDLSIWMLEDSSFLISIRREIELQSINMQHPVSINSGRIVIAKKQVNLQIIPLENVFVLAWLHISSLVHYSGREYEMKVLVTPIFLHISILHLWCLKWYIYDFQVLFYIIFIFVCAPRE